MPASGPGGRPATRPHARLPAEPHWYLGVLAIYPEHAGRWWGRWLLEAGLCTAAAAGVPAALETSTAANVALYRRPGFEVIETLAVGGLPEWMTRRG